MTPIFLKEVWPFHSWQSLLTPGPQRGVGVVETVRWGRFSGTQ